MKLGPITKLDKKNVTTSKKIDNDVRSAKYEVIVIFPGDVCQEESRIWIMNAWSIISTFSLIAISYLRKTENRAKKSL